MISSNFLGLFSLIQFSRTLSFIDPIGCKKKGIEYLDFRSIDPDTGDLDTPGTQHFLQLKNSTLPNLKYRMVD